MTFGLRRLLCAVVGAFALWAAMPAPSFAQDPPAREAKREARRKKRADKKKKPPRGEAKPAAEAKADPKPEGKGTSSGKGPLPAPSAQDAARAAAQEAAQGVDTEIVKEGDTSVKVMQFSGLDIEGRLKSPQLLYFVNRVRAEFDRPRLPHRSFMPEVERAAQTEPLR